MGHDSGPELSGDAMRAGHGRGRLVAVAAVLATLAAATTGYLQAAALRAHDEADVRAERLGAIASDVAATNEDQALVQIERYRTRREVEIQARRAVAAAHGPHRLTALPEAQRWAVVAASMIGDTGAISHAQRLAFDCTPQTALCRHVGLIAICDSSEADCGTGARYSPGEDRYFPIRYEEVAQRESYRLNFEREAADAEAQNAEDRFAHLAAALTMLTVAVFLFGYSLTPRGRERRKLFITCATLFVVAGSAWSTYHAVQGYTRPSSAAAAAFANGEVALNAYDFPVAVKELSRATRLWSGSSRAYSELATAQYEMSIPKTDPAGVLSVPSKAVLRTAIEDDERAQQDGSNSPVVTFDLGANLLFLGLETHDDSEIQRARELSENAARRFTVQTREEGHPGPFLVNALFSIAEADLALNRAAAGREYCAAIGGMLAAATEVPPKLIDTAAHTDVGVIENSSSGRKRSLLRARADRILRMIDAAVSSGKAPKCTRRRA